MPRENRDMIPKPLRPLIDAARLKAVRSFQVSRHAISYLQKRTKRTSRVILKHSSKLLNHPALTSRLNDDYLRGGAEFLTAALALSAVAYTSYKGIVRYRTAQDIPQRLISGGKVLHGFVVSVRDGDGFRVRHVPLLRRLLNDYKVPRVRRLSEHTISVRLAAVDAPESAQKYGRLAKDWLKDFSLGQKVSLRMHSMDRYSRLIATVHRKHQNPILRTLGLGRKNVSLELVRAGYATLYTGAGAQYGGEKMKGLYMAVEAAAKRKGIGMWADKNYISPMDFKKAIRSGDLSKLASKAGPRTDRAVVVKETIKPARSEEPSDSLLTALYKFAAFSYQFLRRYR